MIRDIYKKEAYMIRDIYKKEAYMKMDVYMKIGGVYDKRHI